MKTSASYSISSVNDGEKGQDYNHYKGDWFISADGVGYDFSFPPVPIGMNDVEVKINQNDLEGSVRILCNSNVVTSAINGADGIKEWKSFKINNSFVNTNSDNIIRIEHIAGASADWGHIFEVVFLFSKTGVPGIKGDDGDLGILTLSYSSTTISLQGNGKTQGYIIYNNQKFYLNSTYSFITKGDGVIIVDISTSTPTVTYKKLIIVNEMLVFVDFNTGLEPLSKSDVDSNWQYLLIGEFSCLNEGAILNASLKPIISVTTFLSSEFVSILRQKGTTKEKIFEWAKVMGCDSYFNILATSQLFVGQIFANEIILTENGVIKSSIYNDTAGFSLNARGDFVAISATISGNTHILGNATIDLADNQETLLKTQYGSDGTIELHSSSKTRWNSRGAYNSTANGENGTSSYTDGSITYSHYQKNSISKLSNCLLIGEVSAIAGRPYYGLHDEHQQSFTIQQTGNYHIDSLLNGLYRSVSIKVNGKSVFQPAYTSSKVISLNKGDTVVIYAGAQGGEIAGQPTGGYGKITVKFYENGLYLYNGTPKNVTAMMKLVFNTNYVNRLILASKWDSNSYINRAPINGWYNSLTDNGTFPCKATSIVNIEGADYIVKYVIKDSGIFKIITTTGITKTFIAPSSNIIPSNIGWYNISGTIYLAGESRGLVTSSLIPVSKNSDIGDPVNRYDTVFSNVTNTKNVVADEIHGKVYAS